ncbi:hypothetical protein Xekk_02534 [Xenorhabdus sp. KK7.4]|nr:hypothetical protein Xekk_02534 [Xenorhabdus sp. KK7.4]
MKKYLLLCLVAGSAILAPVLTYANTSKLPPNIECALTHTLQDCILPYIIPPTNP